MRPFVYALGICLLGTFLAPGESSATAAALKKKGAQKNHAHTVKGVVAKVEQAGKKEGATITVKVRHKKKKGTGQGGAVAQKTFRVGPKTSIFHNGQPATWAALHAGERVLLHTLPGHPHQLARIDIMTGKKGKKKA